MRLEKKSPCKVNLLLNILGKRADGFHELETIFQPVNFCDDLTFERSGNGIQLSCSDKNLPTDSRNLIYRTAEKFLAMTKISDGVEVHLEKKIPMAAGLGGGSGNAATTLLALNELFDKPLSEEKLHELAASLGSDINFFLQNKPACVDEAKSSPNPQSLLVSTESISALDTSARRRPALATGRGEKIQSLENFPALEGKAIFLIHPGFGISTPWAYQNLARFPEALNGKKGRAKELIEKLQTKNLAGAAGTFYNSLEAPAFEKFPILKLYQEFSLSNGALAALMSGSGSTTFAIAGNISAAEKLAEKFKSQFGSNCWTTIVKI